MSGWLDALLRVHLTCDAGATIAFWIAAMSAKGGVRHRAAGRWFMRFVYGAGFFGGILAVVGLLSPALIRPSAIGLPPASQAEVFAEARHSMWLVLYILVILVAPVHHGVVVVRAASVPASVRSSMHTLLAVLAIASGPALFAAAWYWSTWTYLVIAPIGPVLGVRHLRYRTRLMARRPDWQREHLTSMLMAGIVLHTALLVFVSSRTLGLTLAGPVAFVPWLLPVLVGLPAILYFRRRYS